MSPTLAMIGDQAWRLALAVALVAWATMLVLEILRRAPALSAGDGVAARLGAAAVGAAALWSTHVLLLAGAPAGAVDGYPVTALVVAALVALVGALVSCVAASSTLGPGAGLPFVAVGALVASIGPVVIAQRTGLFAPEGGVSWPALALGATAALAGAAGALLMSRRVESRGGLAAAAVRVAAATWASGGLVGAQALGIAAVSSTPASVAGTGGVAPQGLTLLASVGLACVLAVVTLALRLDARGRARVRQAHADLRRAASVDPLTDLPNRGGLEDRLATAVAAADTRAHGAVGLLYVDLDGFKPINESLGHAAGDRLLQELARRLRALVPARELVARLNGDKFLVLVEDEPTQDSLARLAGAILKALQRPVTADGRELVIGCSVGIARYPEHGAAAMLLSRAEAAMQAAKRSGGGTYCFFEPHMASGAREQVELLRELRAAIEGHQLELYFQPKIHAPTGEITGAEALMRWNHPKRGLVSPAVFIPIAERFGLIGALGDWLIDEACRQARAWRDQGLRMRVAINLSVHQMRQDDLVDRIAEALSRHKVNPRLLTCEITETAAMDDTAATRELFERLARLGVHISIDDFGTGYSSLASLRKLPAEELKIDQGFVQDLETSEDARAIVDAVVKMAHALGLKVVAEGVETEAQHRILRALGCQELQGYVFAKPMSAQALALWAMDEVGPRPLAFRPSLFADTSVSAHDTLTAEPTAGPRSATH
jgi:diguanylate cyclase (GGDEF)-like protein